MLLKPRTKGGSVSGTTAGSCASFEDVDASSSASPKSRWRWPRGCPSSSASGLETRQIVPLAVSSSASAVLVDL